MRKFLPLLMLLCSCQASLFDPTPRWMRMQDRNRHEAQAPDAPDTVGTVKGADIYLTAFRYPQGVDWQAHPETPAEVVLYKNGRELLSVPTQGPPEPERHRVCHGRLWTDWSDGNETVVSCDGVERFRFAGEELFRGFLEVNGMVHTLGQRQGREGFCYRVNGAELFNAPTGTLLGSADEREWEGGAFCRDSSGLYYSYGIPIQSSDGQRWEYRVMRGADLLESVPAGTAEALFDIRVLDGIVYRSERRAGYPPTYCLVKDKLYRSLDVGPGESMHFCKLVNVNGRMLVKGYSTGVGSHIYTYWLRDPAGIPWIALSNDPIGDLISDGTHQAHVVLNDAGLVRSLWLDREGVPFTSDTYRLATPRCLTLKDGILGAALSRQEGDEHLVMLDGKGTRYTFNGYFTSLVID